MEENKSLLQKLKELVPYKEEVKETTKLKEEATLKFSAEQKEEIKVLFSELFLEFTEAIQSAEVVDNTEKATESTEDVQATEEATEEVVIEEETPEQLKAQIVALKSKVVELEKVEPIKPSPTKEETTTHKFKIGDRRKQSTQDFINSQIFQN